jgi:conjugative relaxase-like TrwC/TraI family protein
MLSPKTQYNLKNAQEYFEEHLCAGDYYSEGQRIRGQWFGKGAEALGLRGDVGRDEFLALCENHHPQTGESLTQRRKNLRREVDDNGAERNAANRRVFYDFTLSPPKSVSIAALAGSDERIIEAHSRAVSVAMGELEAFASTRVRRGGGFSDRETGNVVGATFHHDTSRALDPHLHSHCIIFNATHDASEDRWKALQNYEMLRAQKYVENVYYHELARALIGFGYESENHRRGDFELKGITPALRDKFSKRHAEIDEKTRALLLNQPEKASGNVADIREHIAHAERSRKIKTVGQEKLRSLWKKQMTNDECAELAGLRTGKGRRAKVQPSSADAALRWAEDHVFDRRSVVSEHELWRHALEFARGSEMEIAALKATTAKREYLRDETKPRKLTTREVLGREWDILQVAKDGVGRHRPFNATHVAADSLDEEQRNAVGQILCSVDFLTLFRGAAGTGKSFALREVLRGLEGAGHAVHIIAPQRQQVIDLEAAGFAGAQTVSEFLTRKSMRPGGVVIVDETGQLGAKQMQSLLGYVKENGGRIICSGDTRQHGAVEASDALRAIEKYSGLKAAELTAIRRQDPTRAKTNEERSFIEEYKQAVQEASVGLASESFDRLERQGAVVECRGGEQQELLAGHYLELAGKGESTVVVAQTWSEIRKVNESARDALKRAGLIGAEEHAISTLESVDLTDAQKRDARSYEADSVIVFNRDTSGFRKGQRGRLVAMIGDAIVVEAGNKIREIPFAQLARLTVCRERETAVAVGDRLQLKANAKTKDGRPLANGELVTVAQIEGDGRIVLQDGRALERNYRQFVRGYAVTSYASQGKTVDYVLFSDSAVKAATNRQQWYVTISRGRKGVRIFTADKEQLRENISRSGDRELALDLTTLPQRKRRSLRRSLATGLTRGRQLAATICHRIAALASRMRVNAARREVSVS